MPAQGEGRGYQGRVSDRSAPGLDPPQLGATYRVGPFFPGRRLRRLGIRLVHSRLGKGMVNEAGERDSEVPKTAQRKRGGCI